MYSIKKFCLFVLNILLLFVLVFGIACYTQPSYCKASGKRVELINRDTAVNPTWEDLKTFLRWDDTNYLTYSETQFNCVDYAETLHNNAEKYNIKSAFVAINFSDQDVGHAINAFDTIDKGLVFIDCSGQIQAKDIYGESIMNNADKVGYLKIGSPYIAVDVQYARGFDYFDGVQFWNSWMGNAALLDMLEDDILSCESEIADMKRTGNYIDIRIAMCQAWFKDYENKYNEFISKFGNTFYVPMGEVESVDIYW